MLLLRLLLLAVMKLDVILIYVMNCRLMKILESVANTLIQSTVSVTTTVRVLFPVKSFFFEILFQPLIEIIVHVRWLTIVLRAVSGNSHDSACFKLDK